MAREWALRGVSEEELRPPEKPEPPKDPKGKLENFWYHYKWHTIAAVAAVIVLTILIADMVTKTKPDYSIVFATQNYVSSAATDKLKSELEAYGRDINGDGKVVVQFDTIVFSLSDYQVNTANQMKFAAHLSAKDMLIFIVDKETYQNAIAIHEKDGYKFFSPIGVEVEGLEDGGRYWNWKGSELRKLQEMVGLPEDLYFGVRDISGSTDKKSKEVYEQSMELIKAFLTKKPLEPTGTTSANK